MPDSSAKSAATAGTIRFNVLFHTHPDGAHYDLLIACGEALATWKLSIPPDAVGVDGTICEQITDHRLIYLDYEGPISGNRGNVVRHDCGECTILVRDADRWLVRFDGRLLHGEYELSQSASSSSQWSLRRLT